MAPSANIIDCKDQTISFNGTPFESLQEMIPPKVNRKLEFEIKDSCCEMVNAIRRTLMSEMPVIHLTAALADIKTTDPYLIGENILKRIEMIPVAQSIDPTAKFSVRFENSTDECVDVLSTEILRNGKSVCDDILPGISICDINPSKEFVVSNIYVTESYGYSHSRATIGSVSYGMLDQDFSQSSLVANPSNFIMTVETSGILDPVEMVRRAIDCLIRRLETIDYENAITEFGIYKLKIHNETHSIGRLLSHYLTRADKSVAYSACRIPHPSKREVIVDIMHPAGESLCTKAVSIAIDELKSLRNTFK